MTKKTKTKKTPTVNFKFELGTPSLTGEKDNQIRIPLTFRDVKNHKRTIVTEVKNQVDKYFMHLFKVDLGRLTVVVGDGEEAVTVPSDFGRGHRVSISRACKKLMVALASDETVDPALRAAAATCLDKTGRPL